MLGNAFFCRLLIFFQNYFFQKITSGTLSECHNGLDLDQDGYFVGHDLGPNCLIWFLADDIFGS